MDGREFKTVLDVDRKCFSSQKLMKSAVCFRSSKTQPAVDVILLDLLQISTFFQELLQLVDHLISIIVIPCDHYRIRAGSFYSHYLCKTTANPFVDQTFELGLEFFLQSKCLKIRCSEHNSQIRQNSFYILFTSLGLCAVACRCRYVRHAFIYSTVSEICSGVFYMVFSIAGKKLEKDCLVYCLFNPFLPVD